MQLFYVSNVQGNEITLDESESKHAIRVLRLNVGDKVQVVDGKGGFFIAEITVPHQKKCKLSILESHKEFGKKDFVLHIAIAPTKNTDRLEWFLEKATEIGIDEITPVLCERSERKTINPERLEKILVSAMKQSVKAYLPKLNPLTPFNELIPNAVTTDKFIAHCNEEGMPHLKNEIRKGKPVLILIGPEGDFSLGETEMAKNQGFKGISLGNSRLRTETAGVVACHIVNLAND